MLENLNGPLFGTPEDDQAYAPVGNTVLTYVTDCVGPDGVKRKDYVDDPGDPVGVVVA
jgi:hypothetical protein